MNCEVYTRDMNRCSRRATRPVDRNGFCVWSCTQHGKGKVTYKLYRPWRGRHITTKRAVSK
jgi:hypothetical protein